MISNALKDPRLVVGGILTLLVVALAVFGPWLAPFAEDAIVGRPYTTDGGPLGTDYLGQDVLSRVLYGGRSVLITAVLATILGVGLGALIGVVAAYAGGWLDEVCGGLRGRALRAARGADDPVVATAY